MDIDFADVTDSDIDSVKYSRITFPTRKGLSTATYMEGTIARLEERFREIRPSIVIAASFYITALPAIIAARRLGIPVIYEVRGLAEITRLSRDNSYEGSNDYTTCVKMETETANAADHVFTLTNGMQNELVRRGVPENKITLLPNACDTDRFVPKARDEKLARRLGINPNVPVIGYIGTIVDYEGLDDLVKACGLLRKRGFEFRLMIVGSEDAIGTLTTPITTKLKESAKSNGIDNWLIISRRVPHHDIKTYYSLIDIAPFPRKPWPVCEMVSPMKPLEALAMGKAVVVSSVQALTDMISDGVTGLVFEKGNVESLTSALQKLIENDVLRSDLGNRGREFVKTNRNWKSMAKKSITVLDEVIKQGPTQTYKTWNKQKIGYQEKYPAWRTLIDPEFANKCNFTFIGDWRLSTEACELRKMYIDRFGAEAVNRRIPMSNWKCADICWNTVPRDLSTIDIGSGLGEFVNLFAINNRTVSISSVDIRDWDQWFDSTGRIERIYKNIFHLAKDEARDVVTCFEVIEHLPPSRVEEAVSILRKLAKKKLFISVPFLEPLPMYKGHFTRFTEETLSSLFPDAKFTVFAKGMNKKVHAWIFGAKVHAWILCEINMEKNV